MWDVNKRLALPEIARRAIWLLFTIIIGYLLIASIFSTCYLGSYSYSTLAQTVEINREHTYYIRDFFLQHFVVFIAFSVFLVMAKTEKISKIIRKKNWGLIVCIIAGILAAVIVLVSRYYPKYDQWHVIDAAAKLNQHIYTDFEPGGYLYVFPFQIGTVLYYRLLGWMFGDMNYVAFQLVNCVWITLSYWLFMRIAGILWKGEEDGRLYEAATAVVSLFFVPYLLYSTFLYGTVVGMAFALLSFYMMLCYEQNAKLRYLLFGGLSMGIATVTKSNYMIYMIAQIIYLLFRIWEELNRRENTKKTLQKCGMILALLAAFAIGSGGGKAYIRSINQGSSVQGIPMTAWIAMGLQDGKGAPGWYNGYNNTVYTENSFDYEKTSDAVAAEIKKIVSGYPKDISTTVSFFVKKISSQWNNPTFQSLWILEEREGGNGLTWLLGGNGRYLYILLVNMLHTWILAGTFLYGVLRFKKNTVSEIILPLTFVGGFLFHIFWEAEGLYAIIYIPLLLPLSVCGYAEWRRWLLTQKTVYAEDGQRGDKTGRIRKNAAIGIAAVIAICALSYTDPFAKLFARNENTGYFDTYTQETVNEHDALPE